MPPYSCTAQVYRVAQRSFLPKDWIMEQWDKGFYITGGCWLVGDWGLRGHDSGAAFAAATESCYMMGGSVRPLRAC